MVQQRLFSNIKGHTQGQASLNSEVSSLLKGLKNERKEKFAFWDDTMGKKISKVAVPVKNKKGVLFVKVEDSIWRFELARNKEEIIKKLNDHLKKNTIKDIVFV